VIKYAEEWGADRQLNEIVFAGSHDAAITNAAGNAQTQSLSIHKQARAGVRFFDIRIGAATVAGPGGQKGVELRAFHAQSLAKDTKTRISNDLGRTVTLERNKLKHESMGEAWGLGLTKILQGARKFVESADGRTEFLILKFDKCSNWPLIAEACRKVLGDDVIYSDGGNVNEKTLGDLAGHVICAFMPDGYAALKLPQDRVGITPIKNLYKPPDSYKDDFVGLQYWGAGGTKINNKGFEGKIQENITTQRNIMRAASTGIQDKMKGVIKKKLKTPGCGAANPNALGMMYWTTTGVFKNIRARNDEMWDPNNHLGDLKALWQGGYQDYIDNALPDNVDALSFSSGGTLKIFMPNIVMIDFSDPVKCDEINKLNNVAGTKLVEVCRKLDIVGGRNG
jgi:hypothetical protein